MTSSFIQNLARQEPQASSLLQQLDNDNRYLSDVSRKILAEIKSHSRFKHNPIIQNASIQQWANAHGKQLEHEIKNLEPGSRQETQWYASKIVELTQAVAKIKEIMKQKENTDNDMTSKQHGTST